MKQKNNIASIKLIKDEFEEKFKNFDYEIFEKVKTGRSLNEDGFVYGSNLIMEIANILPFFINKKFTEFMGLVDACFAAYWGWKLSYDFSPLKTNDLKLKRVFEKFSKQLLKEYKSEGLEISLSDVSKIIFICALIRENLYKEFLYDMNGIFIHDDKIKILSKMAYAKDAPLKNVN